MRLFFVFIATMFLLLYQESRAAHVHILQVQIIAALLLSCIAYARFGNHRRPEVPLLLGIVLLVDSVATLEGSPLLLSDTAWHWAPVIGLPLATFWGQTRSWWGQTDWIPVSTILLVTMMLRYGGAFIFNAGISGFNVFGAAENLWRVVGASAIIFMVVMVIQALDARRFENRWHCIDAAAVFLTICFVSSLGHFLIGPVDAKYVSVSMVRFAVCAIVLVFAVPRSYKFLFRR